MRKKTLLTVALAIICAVSAFGVDKLAIAEPVVKAGVLKDEGEMLWGMLEELVASEAGDKYMLVSRAALQQLMTEIGLTTSSDLVNLNSVQRAKLGQLETVKYLLISEIGKFGTKVNCTMRLMDSSTGVIDPMRTVNLRCKDLDEVGDQLEWAVKKLFSDKKALERSAVLTSLITSANAPAYLGTDFDVILESCLINNGISVQNLKSVNAILSKNGIGSLDACEPKTYVQIGRLLEVKNLIRSTLDRFEILATPYSIPETGASGTIYTGVMSGNIRIISTADGETLVLQPFETRVEFRHLPPSMTMGWTAEDYGKYMIRSSLGEHILPELFHALAAKQQSKDAE